MHEFKKIVRKKSSLVEVIILLVGIVFVLCGFKSSVLSGIGASIIASAIVVFMTDVFIGGEESDSARQWGLEAVYKTRGAMNGACDSYLEKAKNVSVIAFGLKSWRDSQQKQIERILDSGGIIRIITMEPGCANLMARETDEHSLENEISHSIEQLIEWGRKENAKGFRGRIEIKHHTHLPLDFMFLMDNRLFTGPYEYGKDSQQSLSFEYNTVGNAYEYYKNYFNELWGDNDFCKDALGQDK